MLFRPHALRCDLRLAVWNDSWRELLFPRGFVKLPARPATPSLPGGGRSLPLLAEIFTLLGGQFVEPPGPAPDPFLLFRGKTPKVMVSFADEIAVLGWKLLPSLETLLCLFSFLGAHALPSFRSPAKALLPLGRQLIPLPFVGPQDLLLLRGEPMPWAGKNFAG